MRIPILLAALAAVLASGPVMADDDDDDERHEHRHGKGKKHKEEFWDGNCKVTREWKKDGEYKEKRKCKAPERQVYVVPPPPPQPAVAVVPWMHREQGHYAYKPQYRPAPVAGTYRCNSKAVGQVLGGIVGGVLGNQIGKGDGRTLATVGGAVAGVLVGGEVGRRMDAQDQGCVGEVLEVAPAGRRVQWDDGPANYVVVPGQVNYVQGSYCRPYTMEMRIEGQGTQRTRGTACRRPDGVWVAS